MNGAQHDLDQWQLHVSGVRDGRYRARTPGERERWHALRLLGHGWSVNEVAEASERDKKEETR